MTVLVGMVLAGGRVASAQSTGGGTLPNGTTVNFDKLYIHEDGAKVADLPKRDPESLWNYFNLAHCQCSRGRIQGDARIPSDFVEDSFQYLVLASGSTAPINEPLNIWVGASCNTDSTTRSTMCHPIKDQAPTISNIQATNDVRVTIPIYDAMTPEPAGGDCQQRVLSATIWGLADSSIGSGLLDYSTTKSFTTDSQPPPLPTDFNAAGGDTAIVISWKPPVDASDVYAYQALCSRVE
ncbi:MAG TPA: hypothetical protein VFT22_02205, partial [Kofleriaceae bacterium]|nr:hypothetical protein [Kofleriaceae bacterium]